jgi:hypothetical protein
MHGRTLHRYSFVMPIRAETSDQTIYCAMFGQCDPHNRPWCSVERALGMARQAGIEKIDFKIVLSPISKQPKSCSG